MRRHRDRILDRIWLGLSGAVLVAVMLQLGAGLGRRRWFDGMEVAAARAAAPAGPARPPGPAGPCAADGPDRSGGTGQACADPCPPWNRGPARP
jgi:hypothetical protein